MIYIIVGAVCLAAVTVTVSRAKHPVRVCAASALGGFAALAAAGLIGEGFGMIIPINFFTAGVAAVLGFPGVAALAALWFIF